MERVTNRLGQPIKTGERVGYITDTSEAMEVGVVTSVEPGSVVVRDHTTGEPVAIRPKQVCIAL